MDETPDEALMADVARGDAAALQALYDRYERTTFNLILRLAGSRQVAEELMQETFTRVWTTARLFRPDRGAFKSWLFTIALNLTRSELSRKRYRVRHVEADAVEALPSAAAGPDVLASRAQDARRVTAALARLTPLLREVVVMKVYHQLKFQEIARMTGTPEGTLKARFHRAVAQLRVELGDSGSFRP
jgi:RNA polymerase sigma-70 factor, ECF subfamily